MKFNRNEFSIHAMILIAFILIPLMIQLESADVKPRFLMHFWIMIGGLLLTFYSNYLYAIDKLLYHRKFLLFIAFNVGIFALNDFIDYFVNSFFIEEHTNHREPSGLVKTVFIYYKIIFTALGVGASLAVRYYSKLSQSEREKKALENEKLISELSLLKYQIQPHFLFNTLNNIYSLISKSPEDAQKAVHSLSKMLRYILYDNTSDTIELDKEVSFILNYNKLMKMRVGDTMNVSFDMPDEVAGVSIPPLLLIPLLENAYKHGVLPDGKGFINCKLSIEQSHLVFEVVNSISNTEEDCSCSGIGLQNLQKRIELIYADEASLEAKIDNDKYISRLVIPITING